jgi:hypothetical protein
MKTLFPSIMIISMLATVILLAGPSFSGSWDTNWGRIEMTQKGSKVMGHYAGQFSGIIDGTVAGSRLNFTWSQPNGQYGKGYFDISPDGSTITGSWGIEESDSNGGSWSGTRAGGSDGR